MVTFSYLVPTFSLIGLDNDVRFIEHADPANRSILDWDQRYKIIRGVALGLQYLHEGSRLRIVHRDLKASNVLLDGDFNPKVADFGLARVLSEADDNPNTARVVGTL